MNKYDKDFKKLQACWYKKLKEDGFVDVEGGTEGHLMSGPTPSLHLGAALSAMPGRLSRAKKLIASGSATPSQPGNPDNWLDHFMLKVFDRGKTSYYDAAQKLATIVSHTKYPGELKFTWALHSDGEGEDVIAAELDIPRSRARKYLAMLREKMQILLDISPPTE